MNKNRIFEQSAIITIPTASGSGVAIGTEIQLNQDYKRAKGILLYEVNNPNGDKFDVQLKNRTGEVIQQVYSDHLKASTSVNPNERYRKIDIDTKVVATVNILPIGNTTAQLTLEVIFLLTDEI